MLKSLTRSGADRWIGWGLALITTGLAFVFSYPTLHPLVWGDYAAAAGLHPAAAVTHPLWATLAHQVANLAGPAGLCRMLPMAGRVLLGLAALLSFVLFRDFLLCLSPLSAHPIRQFAVFRVTAALGAAALVTSSVCWTGAQACSPGFLTAFLVLCSLSAYARFYLGGERSYAVLASVSVGLALIDTPLAFMPIAGMLAVTVCRWWVNASGDGFREVLANVRWSCTFLAVLLAIAVLVIGYQVHWDAWSAAGMADDPLQFVQTQAVDWYQGSVAEATRLGWLMVAVLALCPLCGQVCAFRSACEETRPFSFVVNVVMVACFAFQLSQFVAGGRFDVFATLVRQLLHGELARMFAAFLFALGVSVSAAMLSVEFLTRRLTFKVDLDGVLQTVSSSASVKSRLGLARALLGLAALLMVSFYAMASFPGRRAALRMIADYVTCVLDDAKGCTDLCADGLVDEAFRLEAARRGQPLYVRPMLARGGALERYLLRQGVDSPEQLAATDSGSASWLRTRAHEVGATDPNVAVQVGFEVWRYELRRLPPGWGTLARFSGTDAARRRSVGVACALARRLVGETSASVRGDRVLFDALNNVRWRMARMAKYRAEEADRHDRPAQAARERTLRRALEDANETLGNMLADFTRRRAATPRPMTPRESLRLALQSGNAAACEVWGNAILERDPGNGEANYALALLRVSEDDFAAAAEHFRICLELKPSDPVLLNNMAMALVNVERFDEARRYVAKARRIAPESDEIRHTQRLIEDCAAIAATNGVLPVHRMRLRRRLGEVATEGDL